MVVEAIQFTGENYAECLEYLGGVKSGNTDNTLNYPNIITSEGTMAVNVGDWIIKEPFDKERQFYPCKPDIFAQTYDHIWVTVKDSLDSDGTYPLISQHDTPREEGG